MRLVWTDVRGWTEISSRSEIGQGLEAVELCMLKEVNRIRGSVLSIWDPVVDLSIDGLERAF
jgi:hypothetical protein